jgi:hypothetical protein
MANPLLAVSECGEKFLELQHLSKPIPPNSPDYSPVFTNPFQEKRFRARGKKK